MFNYISPTYVPASSAWNKQFYPQKEQRHVCEHVRAIVYSEINPESNSGAISVADVCPVCGHILADTCQTLFFIQDGELKPVRQSTSVPDLPIYISDRVINGHDDWEVRERIEMVTNLNFV